MNKPSAVDFPGASRIHIALAVADLERSRAFYEVFLGIAPTKVRPGYAKFEPQDPSVNLTLNQIEADEGLGRPATHYGVQVKSTDAVREAIERFEAAGLDTLTEDQTTCCYAVQDKVWVVDPDGNRWEVFVVTQADTPEFGSDPEFPEQDSACCPTAPRAPVEAKSEQKGCC